MKRQLHSKTRRRILVTGLVGVFLLLAALTLKPEAVPPAAGQSSPSAPSLGQAFPLWVRFDYKKDSSVVSVKGTTLPGAVVQARGSSVVVSNTGTYALKTSFPLSLVAVRKGMIRRVGFDLPAKAKPYVGHPRRGHGPQEDVGVDLGIPHHH